MPTYEYECEACDKRFEVFQKMADDPLKTCPTCGSSVRRILSGGLGVLFQGSGFYVNDSKKSTASAKKSGDSANPTAESKPAADATAKSAESGAATSEKSTPESKSAVAANTSET